MMPEQPFPVLEEVPDNQDVEAENAEDGPRKPMDEFVNFDGDEEGRFADRQPPGPGHAKYQADAFHERKEAVGERAEGRLEQFRLGQLPDLSGKLGPEPPLWIQP